jgi:hypothetical protein
MTMRKFVIALIILAGMASAIPAANAQCARPDESNLQSHGCYLKRNGASVHQPAKPNDSTQPPANATARCSDGSYSYSQNRSGTCSHHGGVASWK